MLNCIIIEDQPPAQRILQNFISKIEGLVLLKTFSDAVSAKVFIENNSVALIFLDVHLPKISGIEFLKSTPNHPHIILTTAFSDYAIESYEYNVVDYLLKPFSFERFTLATRKAKNMIHAFEDIKTDFLFIKSGYDLIRVKKQDILYLKSDVDYTEIVTESKVYLSPDSLKFWLEKLDDSFSQIHKSYIINTNQVDKISANQVYLSNKDILPIGRTFKKGFINKLS